MKKETYTITHKTTKRMAGGFDQPLHEVTVDQWNIYDGDKLIGWVYDPTTLAQYITEYETKAWRNVNNRFD